jgi:predicted Zn-dependent peptidase
MGIHYRILQQHQIYKGKFMKRIQCIVYLLLAIAWVSVPAAAEITDAKDYLLENVVDQKLSNNISVTLLNRGYAPTLALIISFRVGSADEEYESVGIAHMLEHMLFKGTDKVGTRNFAEEKKILHRIQAVGETVDRLKQQNPGSSQLPVLEKELKKLQEKHKRYVINTPYSRIYNEIGGINFNASTSRDRTSYYIELPSAQLENWAEVESERLRNPIFRQYYLEREAVIQERLMRYDSQGSAGLVEKFIATAYLAHPYRHPTIGWETTIRTMSLQQVKQFYWNNYIPERMHITIVGKQNPQATVKVLEKYFGRLKNTPKQYHTITKEPQQKGERRVYFKFKANPYLLIGWHKPTAPAKDDYVGDVVSYLLTGSRNSRLTRTLIEEKKLVSSVDSSNGFPGARFDNLFVIDAEPRIGISTETVEKAIYEELEKLQKEVTSDEITTVVNKIKAVAIFQLNTNMGIARQLNYYGTVLGNWRYGADYLTHIKQVTPQDVKQFIGRYFSKENRTVGVLVPSEEMKK